MSVTKMWITIEYSLDALKNGAQTQRPLDPKRVAEILAEFNPAHMRTPALNNRGAEGLFVIDGQHSLEALRQWLSANGRDSGGHVIACREYDSLTLSEEAEVMRALNNQKALSYRHIYGLAVLADKTPESAVEPLLREIGLSGLLKGAPQNTEVVVAIRKVVDIYKERGKTFTQRVMRLCRDGYYMDDASRMDGRIIIGTARLVANYPSLEDGRLAKVTKERIGGVAEILRDAKTRENQVTKGTAAIMEILRDTYDKGLRTGRLIELVAAA